MDYKEKVYESHSVVNDILYEAEKGKITWEEAYEQIGYECNDDEEKEVKKKHFIIERGYIEAPTVVNGEKNDGGWVQKDTGGLLALLEFDPITGKYINGEAHFNLDSLTKDLRERLGGGF